MNDQEFNNFISNIDSMFVSELRKVLDVPLEWTYVNSSLTTSDYKLFLDILGEDNFKFVSASNFISIINFTMFISPTGKENLSKWHKEKEK